MSTNTISSDGIDIFGATFLILLTLKLVGIEPVASWSWWWVTAPLWGGFAFVVALLTVIALFVAMFDR